MKSTVLMLLIFLSSIAFTQPLLNTNNQEASNAQPFSISHLFNQYKADVYQILVINDATGQKTSIGSGFVVGDGHLLATNYHVVSDVLQKENHHLEYIDERGQSGKLTLLDVDVIHDLAITKADKKLGTPMTIGTLPAQGESLYALGNPHDLGFIIVDGINNGILQKSARARILFSGALNSGMSGGPTLDHNGDVVGINVSYLSSGNNISFIVPAEYLVTLLKKVSDKPADINQSIAQQLINDNITYYQSKLTEQWPTTTINHFTVPLAMRDDVRCWDSSPQAEEGDLIGAVSVTCFNDRSTFINNNVSLGLMGYNYTDFSSRESLSSLHFYRLFSQANKIHFNTRPDRDFGDFFCEQDFVNIADHPFKITLCTRPSKHFSYQKQTITDIRMVAAQIGEKNKGLLISVGLDGIQPILGKQVLQHLLEQIKWQN